MINELKIGKTYKRTNRNKEALSNVTIDAEKLAYHQSLQAEGVQYDEIIVRRIHTAPGDSKCESCEA